MGFLSNLFGKKTELPEFDIERFEHLKRDCWIPVCEDGDREVTDSKFSGIPYLREGESWPACPNCKNPMQLFVQLNPESMPEATRTIWGDGMLQFFYCTNYKPITSCELECQAWDPFSKSTLLRVVQINRPAAWTSTTSVKEAFPPKTIVGWDHKDDYPNWEESREITKASEPPSYEDWELAQETYPRAGEKLFGWPYWVQGVEYPNCAECGTKMQLLFQIDSEVNIPYSFGDVGCGHITQCPEHKTMFAFRWACH